MGKNQEFVWNGNDQSLAPKLDDVRSELGGYSNVAASVTDFTIITSESIASGNTFHLHELILTNLNATGVTLTLYGAAAAASERLCVMLGASESVAITGIKGITFVYPEGVYARADGADVTDGFKAQAGGIRRPTALYKE